LKKDIKWIKIILVQVKSINQRLHITPRISYTPGTASRCLDAAASEEVENDPKGIERAKLFRKVSNFADDWHMIFNDGYTRFLIAEHMCNILMKIKIKLSSPSNEID